MKNRSVAAVLLLPFVTFGIYSIYWYVSTKGELNQRGANIPSAILIIVPIVSIWWLWKYSEGVEQVTGGKTQGVLAFVLLWLLGFIGQAILQDSFNKVSAQPAFAQPSAIPQQPVQPTQEAYAQPTPPAPTVTTPTATPTDPTNPTPSAPQGPIL